MSPGFGAYFWIDLWDYVLAVWWVAVILAVVILAGAGPGIGESDDNLTTVQ